MPGLQHSFTYDAVKPLLCSGNLPVEYFTNRDILTKAVGPIEQLWGLNTPLKLLRQQNANGCWHYPNKKTGHATDYDQLETYRQLGFLMQMFGFNKSHPAIQNAAEYLFSKQTTQGDFRGIYGAQFTPNYTAAIAELLIVAGYQNDARIQKVFDWLLACRQNDGGWALPFRTQGSKLDALTVNYTIEPNLTKPFSHLITGIVLRAFAAHPHYAASTQAHVAGELLASRFFLKDKYTDLKSPAAWQTFSYPFWNTDLVSSVHTLANLGFTSNNEQIQMALTWLRQQQTPDGLFAIHKNHDRYHDQNLWLALAICRAVKTLGKNG